MLYGGGYCPPPKRLKGFTRKGALQNLSFTDVDGSSGTAKARTKHPKRKIAYEIGQDISLLSAGELEERIGILKAEITRLEADMVQKNKSKAAAHSLFR
jgi:uncharacterized small protein (DUF1192 family)